MKTRDYFYVAVKDPIHGWDIVGGFKNRQDAIEEAETWVGGCHISNDSTVRRKDVRVVETHYCRDSHAMALAMLAQ